MPRLVALDVADDAGAWRAVGFALDSGGGCRVGTTLLRFSAPAPDTRGGVVGWTLAGAPGRAGGSTLDGIPTAFTDGDGAGPPGGPPPSATHPNGVTGIDHVVVTTPDLDRSVEALGSVGFEARRRRPAGADRAQVFFWAGEVIVELVGPPTPSGDGPARIWGITFVTPDLDATVAQLGDAASPARDAVQPGRRIATLRRSAGLGTAVAFMDPHPG